MLRFAVMVLVVTESMESKVILACLLDFIPRLVWAWRLSLYRYHFFAYPRVLFFCLDA